MSVTIINKDTYFRENIYVSTINLSSKPFLNIPNMSVNGDISTNNVYTNRLSTPTLSANNNSLIQFNDTVFNNSTKITTSIGHIFAASSSTNYTLTTISTKTTIMTITGLPAGVYIFNYSYIIVSNPNTTFLYQLFEYIDNTTPTTNLLTKDTQVRTFSGLHYHVTYGILTSATNTVTFSLMCNNYSAFITVNFSSFNLQCTRIA